MKRHSPSRPVRALAALVAVFGLAITTMTVLSGPALACGTTTPCERDGTPEGTATAPKSSGTIRENYTSGGKYCSVYANGTGFGSFCVSNSGRASGLKSLRERFAGDTFQRCRYREVPPYMPVPFNAQGGEGRYMLQICMQNVDFDSTLGGKDRVVKIEVVWVEDGTDVSDHENPLNNFLWQTIESREQLPVPFLYTRPNVLPIVGVPTFFTFRWFDPANQQVVRDPAGPYADKAIGGPYKRYTSPSGLVIQAEATKIIIDPRQKDMEPVTCEPSTPYNENVSSANQPEGACKILFKRSSASAEQYSEVPLASGLKEEFSALIEVHWRITYGQPGSMNVLGNTEFIMRLTQGIPVQEIQAPNQPPTVIY